MMRGRDFVEADLQVRLKGGLKTALYVRLKGGLKTALYVQFASSTERRLEY